MKFRTLYSAQSWNIPSSLVALKKGYQNIELERKN